MTHGDKVHKVLEFICSVKRTSINTREISENTDLSIEEVNEICRLLIQDNCVRDCSTKDDPPKTLSILRIDRTFDIFETGKYKKTKNDLSNINISGTNINFYDNFNNINQSNDLKIIQHETGFENQKIVQNRLKILIKKFWWLILVPILIGIMLLFIEYGWFIDK